jgi:hypothetical protein
MPVYYFHLRDEVTIADSEGTDLSDLAAARDHAAGVARELMFNSTGLLHQKWADWTMSVRDDSGVELFSFKLIDLGQDGQ